jgi:UDP-3-O-[3-hydroxymyristoyl] glucosamine N-acyltransferase
MDVNITEVVPLNRLKDNSLLFAKKVTAETLERLILLKNCFIILSEEMRSVILKTELINTNTLLFSSNPRLDFARVLSNIESIIVDKLKNNVYKTLDNGIVIGEETEIGKGTVIEPLTFIDHGVIIGTNCVIRKGTVLRSRVHIGNNVIIRENSVIGGPGFGIEKDENGNNFRVPQIGGVIIKDYVEIGAVNTVASGTIEPTVIEEFVKTDDHVHIAHNCYIGKNTSLTACVEISGSVVVGENCMVGPNSSIMNGITIGNNVIIGLGAVVTKSVPEGLVIAGNPAESIEIVKTYRSLLKKIMKE